MRFSWILFLPAILFGEIGYVEPWGKDASITADSTTSNPSPPLSPLVKGARNLILFHQNHLSKTTGPRSHFKPSSSNYTLEAILNSGFLRGWLMGCDRLMRENADPWIYTIRQIDEKWYKWDPPPNYSQP